MTDVEQFVWDTDDKSVNHHPEFNPIGAFVGVLCGAQFTGAIRSCNLPLGRPTCRRCAERYANISQGWEQSIVDRAILDIRHQHRCVPVKRRGAVKTFASEWRRGYRYGLIAAIALIKAQAKR